MLDHARPDRCASYLAQKPLHVATPTVFTPPVSTCACPPEHADDLGCYFGQYFRPDSPNQVSQKAIRFSRYEIRSGNPGLALNSTLRMAARSHVTQVGIPSAQLTWNIDCFMVPTIWTRILCEWIEAVCNTEVENIELVISGYFVTHGSIIEATETIRPKNLMHHGMC